MNTSTKIFATLSLSAAVGQKIQDMNESETLNALGASLYDVGYKATGKYPYPALSKNKTNQILYAVESLLSRPFEPPDILSMLIAGLIDIRAKCKPERYALIDPVVAAAQDCLNIYDDLFWLDNHALFMLTHKDAKIKKEIDHDAAFERYLSWLES